MAIRGARGKRTTRSTIGSFTTTTTLKNNIIFIIKYESENIFQEAFIRYTQQQELIEKYLCFFLAVVYVFLKTD